MKKLNYLRLHWYLFWESVLWTLIDLVRARRMRLAQRMHGEIKKPVEETDQSEAGLSNNGQNN